MYITKIFIHINNNRNNLNVSFKLNTLYFMSVVTDQICLLGFSFTRVSISRFLGVPKKITVFTKTS